MTKKIFICIAGIDGSGKSTAAIGFSRLNNTFKYVWARWKPFFLSPFVKIVNKINKEKDDFEQVYNNKKNKKKRLLKNTFVKDIWLLAAEIDYGLQLIFKVCIPYILNNKIICDRYIYDFYIDQAINLSVSPEDFKSFLRSRSVLRLFPKPQKIIYMNVEPGIAFVRKKDGTVLADLQERKCFYDKLASIYDVDVVDSGKPINEVFVDVSVIMKNYE